MTVAVSPLSAGSGDARAHGYVAKVNGDASRQRFEALVAFTDTTLDNAYARALRFSATIPAAASTTLTPLRRGGIVDINI